MSTMTETFLDIDLSLLVGPMDDMACEHSTHGKSKIFHDVGPATHYIRSKNHCGGGHLIYAACTRWADVVRARRISFCCLECGTSMDDPEHITVVGPVAK